MIQPVANARYAAVPVLTNNRSKELVLRFTPTIHHNHNTTPPQPLLLQQHYNVLLPLLPYSPHYDYSSCCSITTTTTGTTARIAKPTTLLSNKQ